MNKKLMKILSGVNLMETVVMTYRAIPRIITKFDCH
jgi:hypothetical protein